MNPFRIARNYVDKGETSEERAVRRDQAVFVSVTALAVPLLVFASIAIGGREFVLPWILMFALAGVAGCAWRRWSKMRLATPIAVFGK